MLGIERSRAFKSALMVNVSHLPDEEQVGRTDWASLSCFLGSGFHYCSFRSPRQASGFRPWRSKLCLPVKGKEGKVGSGSPDALRTQGGGHVREGGKSYLSFQIRILKIWQL